MSSLRYMCWLAHSCVQHKVCCVFVFPRLVYPMLPVSLDCPFFIPPSAGADPGFCVRGDKSRRGVWGPLKVSSEYRAEPW